MVRARLMIGVGAALLLAACGQATPQTSTPEPMSWWWLVVGGVVVIGVAALALRDFASGRPHGQWEFSGPFGIPLPASIGIPWLFLCGLLCVIIGIIGAFIPAVLRSVERYSTIMEAIETAIPVLTYFVFQAAGVIYVLVALGRAAIGVATSGSMKAAGVIIAISLLYLGLIHFFTGGLAETFIAPLVKLWQLLFG